MEIRVKYGGVHRIRHFACVRDFYVIRNHMYKTLFEPFNGPQKDRNHANKTFSSDICLIRMKTSVSHDF